MKKNDLKLIWESYETGSLPDRVAIAVNHDEDFKNSLIALYNETKNNNQKTICAKCYGVINRAQCFYSSNKISVVKDDFWVVSSLKLTKNESIKNTPLDNPKEIMICHRKCVSHYYELENNVN